MIRNPNSPQKIAKINWRGVASGLGEIMVGIGTDYVTGGAGRLFGTFGEGAAIAGGLGANAVQTVGSVRCGR